MWCIVVVSYRSRLHCVFGDSDFSSETILSKWPGTFQSIGGATKFHSGIGGGTVKLTGRVTRGQHETWDLAKHAEPEGEKACFIVSCLMGQYALRNVLRGVAVRYSELHGKSAFLA